MNNTAVNSCPAVRKQIGKTAYIIRVRFSVVVKETMVGQNQMSLCFSFLALSINILKTSTFHLVRSIEVYTAVLQDSFRHGSSVCIREV